LPGAFFTPIPIMENRECSVLIVDADMAQAGEIKKAIESENYNVNISSLGSALSASLENAIYDLVCISQNTTALTISHQVDYIRSLPGYKQVPIIVLAEQGETSGLENLLNEGVDDFIRKPFRSSYLAAKIRANIKKFRLKKRQGATALRSNLGPQSGKILFCAADYNNFPYESEVFEGKIIEAVSAESLFRIWDSYNYWLILIDDTATWALQMWHKIKTLTRSEVPIVCLIGSSCNQADEWLSKMPDSYIRKMGDKAYELQQLQFMYKRESLVKEKYMSAWHEALEKSVFKFDRVKEYSFYSFAVSILHEPFGGVAGGDFYEILNPSPNLQVIFFGDIMGKTWEAWLFVPAYLAYIRSTITFLSHRNLKNISESPEVILEALNMYLARDLRMSEIFATLTVVVLNAQTNKASIACAGGLSPLYYRADDRHFETVEVNGLLLGISAEAKYSRKEFELDCGDRLLFFTDGYSEAIDLESQRMIGKKGVSDVFREFADKSEMSALNFDDEIIDWYNIGKFDDDRSLLVVSGI
jgi:CheY-like chemotaxis protein